MSGLKQPLKKKSFPEVLCYKLNGGTEDKPGKISLKIDGFLAKYRREYLQNTKPD
jgi:hypothetical protein